MKSLLYISSLPQNSQTGGANAVNYHIYKQLQKHFECTYVEINPVANKLPQWISKIKRKVLHLPGRFDFFSKKRLTSIQKAFEQCNQNVDVIFFRGSAQWAHCKPQVPYFVYNDVHFQQFFENTFDYSNFITKDLNRIFSTEKDWLNNANAVFFESQWGAEQCFKHYQIPKEKLIGLGRGGNILLPETDNYADSLDLLLIANIFTQKGGDLVFKAFQLLKPKYPKLSFHIVGGNPGDEVTQTDGVNYHGPLYKEKRHDLEKLIQLFSQAFLLMHPTREDTNPLVITEAGYFGCPSVTVDHFAIPELVQVNKTGILLPYLPSVNQIALSIEDLILNKTKYLEMRKNTWIFNRQQFSWENIGKAVSDKIKATLY